MIAPMRGRVQRVGRVLRPVRRRFDVATRHARILPSFLVIGAQRAGTTSLFHYLSRHPDVAAPSGGETTINWPKELHFFDERYWRGLDWYRSFFPLELSRRLARRRGGDLVAGEATPYYLFHPAVPERVAESLPEVRLVALLRDPVERAYSHYQLMRRKGWEPLSFEEAIEAEPERLARAERWIWDVRPRFDKKGRRRHHHHRHSAYLARGLYAGQLERWLEHFPREQLLVLRAEDMLADPAGIYRQVLDHVGLRPWEPKRFATRNKASYAPIAPELRERLEEHFAEPNARLAELLGRDFGWTRMPGPRPRASSAAPARRSSRSRHAGEGSKRAHGREPSSRGNTPPSSTVHVLHVSKSGGTALLHAMRAAQEQTGGELVSPWGRIENHGHSFLLADLAEDEVAVLSLRDPVSRFLSGYFSRLRKGAPRYDHEWSAGERQAFEWFPTARELADALAKPRGPGRQRAETAMRSIQHVNRPLTNWTGTPDYFRRHLDRVLYVARQETLDEDWEILKELLDLPRDQMLPRDDVNAHRTDYSEHRGLSAKGIAALRAWYAEDYEILEIADEVRRAAAKDLAPRRVSGRA